MSDEKKQKLWQALSDALDILWIEYGNDFGGEKEKLIAEIQAEIERLSQL